MEIKIFISYYSRDNKKMQLLKKLINETPKLIPVVIADRKRSLVPLTKKVEDGILESQIIVPIITRESISSQWVNQEIGYASALSDIKIMPVIENSIIDNLKGFIHKQVDLSYNYEGFKNNPRKESNHFKKCVVELIDEIKKEYNISTPSNSVDEISDIESKERFFKENYLRDTLKIYEPKIQLKTTIHPFIKNSSGTLSFWAKVLDHHNLTKSIKKHLYIASLYSNNYMATPTLARYPNMWTILRETPTPENKNGKWSFICNGVNKERTSIEYNKPLSTGWHLFSVEWSIQMDFIKFYIDTNPVGISNFANWPEVFDMSMYIGTWPDKNPKSHFYSQISGPIFVGEIDSRILKEIFEYNPIKNQLEKRGKQQLKSEETVKVKNSILSQPIDFGTLKMYSNNYFPNLMISENIQTILLSDINKNKFKTLEDIHNAVIKAESFIQYYKNQRPDYFKYSTDILTKSLGYTDKEFRNTHGFALETKKAFVKFEKITQVNND